MSKEQTGIGNGTGSAALTDRDRELSFLSDKYYELSEEERHRIGNLNNFINSPKANELLAGFRGTVAAGGSQQAQQNALDQSSRNDSATAAYDAGTTVSREEASPTATQNIQQVANDVASGRVNPPRKAVESVGIAAAKSNTEIRTTEDTQRLVDETVKSINSNPQVENALRESGVNVDAEAAPNINDVNKVEGYMKSSIGYNPLSKSPRDVVKDANELGTWDYIAIGLTALSAVMFAATGGEMQPIDFTKIGGTNQRIAALTEVRKQRDEFRSRLANEQSVREAFEAMPPEERALYNNDLEEYRKDIGRTYYETSEKSAQDESDMQTAITLKDIEHKYNKEIIGLNGQWDLTKLKANTEAQKDIARLLQSNKEGEAANIINKLKSAGCSKEEAIQMFGMKGDWQRYWDNAMGAVGTVGTTVANVAGALTSSDKNKKLTKHSYIPINKRG